MELEEIDKLMAEKVMGRTRRRGDYNHSDDLKSDHLYSDERFDVWTDGSYEYIHVFPQPDGFPHWQPTKDMNQAMECVDTIDGFFYIERVKGDFDYHYNVLIRKSGQFEVQVSDPSAPLAICKAILAAKGIDV